MTQSSLPTRVLVALVAAIAALALLAPGASAKEPAPGYTQFTGCPSPEENPNVDGCVHSVIKGGHFQMGNKNVPIEKPIDITGGIEEGLVNFTANSKGGLKPVAQTVPGGVIGLTGLTWLLEFFGVNALSLYATTEAAGQPDISNIEFIRMPVRVHLTTPSGVLGKNCYVGSFTNPIKLNLTYGTTSPPAPNKPITGVTPTFSESTSPPGILELKNGTYVDNAFAAPGASGCVLTLFGFIPISINGLVNTQSGLPAAAGTNETVQEIDTEIVEIGFVYP